MLDPWLVKFIVVTVIVAWFLTTIASMMLDGFEVPASLTGAFVALAGGAIAQSKGSAEKDKANQIPPAPPEPPEVDSKKGAQK